MQAQHRDICVFGIYIYLFKKKSFICSYVHIHISHRRLGALSLNCRFASLEKTIVLAASPPFGALSLRFFFFFFFFFFLISPFVCDAGSVGTHDMRSPVKIFWYAIFPGRDRDGTALQPAGSSSDATGFPCPFPEFPALDESVGSSTNRSASDGFCAQQFPIPLFY